MVYGKWPYYLKLTISPPWPNTKDIDQAPNPVHAIVHGWIVPSLPANPRDKWGYNNCDDPPLSASTVLAA